MESLNDVYRAVTDIAEALTEHRLASSRIRKNVDCGIWLPNFV
jgi:hypothetical protein